MSEFDGKQFYGFSMQNDPSLSTTTKNFEFRYIRPEFLEKAIQKVHNKDDSKIKRKDVMWQNYCRMRPATPETEKKHIGILKKDLDVETRINNSISKDTEQIRKLSDNEVEKLIDKIKHKHEASPSNKSTIHCYSPHEKGHQSRPHDCSPKEETSSPTESYVHKYKMISSNKEESCVQIEDMDQKNQSSVCTSITKNKTIYMVDNFEPQMSAAHTPQIIDVVLEEYRRPHPKWVEIEEPSRESRLEIDLNYNDIEIYNCGTSQPPYSNRYDYYKNHNMEYHQMPMQQCPQKTDCMPVVLMTEVITDDVRRADEYVNSMQYNGGNIGNYIVEDSDIELELIHRSQYTKHIKPRSKPDEMLNLSIFDDQNRVAEFVEIESGKPEEGEQYLINSSPLQFADYADDIFDTQSQKNNHMKIYINGLTKQPCENEHHLITSETTKTTDRCLSPQKKQVHSKTTKTPDRGSSSTQKKQLPLKSKTKPTFTQQLPSGTCSRSTAHHDRVVRKSTPDPSQSGLSFRSASVDKETFTNRRQIKIKNTELYYQRSKNLFVSKSIEDLKAEKTSIFHKMTATQEKMIEVLDKLRLSLLEINIPENCYEKTRRQKNAFEFSVRFSRNFLYPLKGMQEDLRFTSNEQFNSLSSNEACNRLCYMYGLLLQSLNTYQKQLRFFPLDHVHQKLITLTEIICSTTAICLEKKIFSKHDVIVDCLQQRCSKFLAFLVELQEGRLQKDRQSYRKLTSNKAQSKYDLKMFMNDLNMYEPKLVPKVIVPDRSAKTKRNKAKRRINQVIVDDSPDTLVEKQPEDTIPTHIQGVSNNKSSGCVLNSQCNMASGDGIPLDKTVIEALQNVTKEQIRQVLEPILQTLGSALDNQHNSETIETILNAFHIKKCSTLETDKQQNIDNKYAKETESKTIVNSLENTCKSLKAAKQTKTLRQQNCHGTLSKKRSSTTTGIIVDDDDDNSNNGNNKNNRNNNANSKRNNKRNSREKNSTTHMRSADGGGGDDCCVGGEHSNEAIHIGETTTMTESVLNKINKSKKLMNEDQIDETERQDIQYYGNLRNKEIQEDISTSDSEGGHNPKLKKHLRRTNLLSFSKLSKSRLKLYDSCISTQRSSSHHSQCQIPSSSKNSSNIMLSHRNSLLCLQTVKTKSRSLTNKRDQTSPPAPLVTPSSSSSHIIDNREIDEETQLDQIPSQRTNIWEKFNSMDNFKIALTENTETLETGNVSGHECEDYAETRELRTTVECDGDFKLDTDNEVETSSGASYIKHCNKRDLAAYANSSYNTSEDTPLLKSIGNKLKYKKSEDKIKPMLPLKSTKKNNKTYSDQPLRQDNLKNPPTENMNRNEKNESKTNIHIDEMIQERDRFLELCIKNRFYKNPNYAEPWKVFSSISESLLNDVLNSVENDFAVGVSKFVEDFLELETKT